MYLLDPFNLAKSVVTVYIDGIQSLNMGKGHYYPLKTDQSDVEIYDTLQRRIEERYPEVTRHNSHLIHLNLAEGVDQVLYVIFVQYYFINDINFSLLVIIFCKILRMLRERN